jgi:DNA repair exonuclease SbcCD ATPase subunit
MLWIGLAFVVAVIVICGLLAEINHQHKQHVYFRKWYHRTRKVIVMKEQRIVELKSELKIAMEEQETAEQMAFDQAKELCEKDKQIEAQLARIEEFTRNTDEHSPCWYRGKYVELIQEVANDKMLIKLLEDANAIYSARIKERDQELDNAISDLAVANRNLEDAWGKIDMLRQEYNDLVGEKIGATSPIPVFSQVTIPEDEKANQQPY